MVDYTYSESFNYSHDNPYHDRLKQFDNFVFRDHEAEQFKGKWNEDVFKKQAPLYLEIGTGYGHFMMDFCAKNPEINYIGMDYRFKRSFQLAEKLEKHQQKNFKYLRAKGERIQFLFEKNEIDNIFYFFPDPWPKTRHHKKRLFQKSFLQASANILNSNGKIYIKTDHDQYAKQIKEVTDASKFFNLEFETENLLEEHPDHFLASFTTKFEKIFIKQKIKIKAFVLKATGDIS